MSVGRSSRRFSLAVLGLCVLASACDKPKPSIATVVYVSMRASVLGSSSGVLQIDNLSGRRLPVSVLVRNKENQQVKSFEMTIDPRSTWDIGWTYGWDFQPNEEIFLNSQEYQGAFWETTRMENGGVGVQPQH
jgi:hypothetical protein